MHALISLLALGAMYHLSLDDSLVLPQGWGVGITGHGAAKWEVIREADSSVLRQSGEATFCWAVNTQHAIKDGFAQAKIKALSGREDQAGGLVFRFQDANNYYVVRANALEDNVVLYKTVAGKRTPLQIKGRMIGYGVDVPVPARRWNVLRVEFHGEQFRVFFNGEKLFDVEDQTFEKAGSVGLWTKADSVTLFDDVSFGATID
jgi:hypothetical protein